MSVSSNENESVRHSLSELRSSGLLYAINKLAFHPLGLALSVHYGDDSCKDIISWSLISSDDGVWTFDEDDPSVAEARAAASKLLGIQI